LLSYRAARANEKPETRDRGIQLSMKPKATPLTTTLSAAAASASALFALQSHADAAIVYSGLLDTVLSPGPGGIVYGHLDLNGGGNDFRIGVGVGASTSHSAGINLAVDGGGHQVLHGFGPSAVRPVASGAVISAGAGAGWVGSGGVLRAVHSSTAPRGSWVTGQTRFAGIRLALGGGNFDYGWIRMRMDDTNPADGIPDTLTILDWAYENDANTAITTPVSAPEPSSAALLALAGGGGILLRRQRKVAPSDQAKS
jgi:hypothetical protein